MIKRFNNFINESLLDKISSPTEEDIKNYYKNNPYKYASYAIFNNNINILKDIFSKNIIDLNKSTGYGKTYRQKYVSQVINTSYDNLEMFKLLEEYNCIDELNIPFYLNYLTQNNNINIIKYIFDKYNVNSDDIYKSRVLLISISNNNLEILKFLIENGADVNKEYSGYKTPVRPLEYALGYEKYMDNKEIISYLKDKGAK